jgi:hypothetical protein
MIWLSTAWAWIKKNWKWLLFPIGILLFVLGKASSKKNFTVVNPELTGAEQEKLKAREEAEAKIQDAKEKRRVGVAKVEQEHAETIDKLTDEQLARAAELKDDPEELNTYLLDIGKEIRG